MNYWKEFIIFGGSLVLIPAALAISAWLVAGRAWHKAWLWSVLFVFGLGMVAATQIAFIGWGIQIDLLDFQGFSGHSMRSAAVAPVMSYLILQNASQGIRLSGVLAGILFAAMMGIAVSVHDTHSASEAIGGCILGYGISFGFIRMSQPMKKPVLNRSAIAVIAASLFVTVFLAINLMTDSTYDWLRKSALYLSGNDTPFTRRF